MIRIAQRQLTEVRQGLLLRLVPALRAAATEDDRFILTRKFIDGVSAYAERWPGPVEVFLHATSRRSENLDEIAVHNDELPFRLRWLNDESERQLLEQPNALLLVTLVDRHLRLIERAAASGATVVLISELTARTRRQIVRSEVDNPLLSLRRQLWTTTLERKYRRALRQAHSVQCNGTPVFNAYRRLDPNALLYFDTRLRDEMIISEHALEQRIAELMRGGPFRLAFSGRLTAIKGVMDLVDAADHLRRRGVRFALDLHGDGETRYVNDLRRRIQQKGLDDLVHLRGVRDFASELVPALSEGCDLFLCAHGQGDPSCTYLETMGCGVPIVGYANEAFSGLASLSKAGWVTPMRRPERLAEKIAELSGAREAVAEAARSARKFASLHSFQFAMQRRVEHMLKAHRSHRSATASGAFTLGWKDRECAGELA